MSLHSALPAESSPKPNESTNDSPTFSLSASFWRNLASYLIPDPYNFEAMERFSESLHDSLLNFKLSIAFISQQRHKYQQNVEVLKANIDSYLEQRRDVYERRILEEWRHFVEGNEKGKETPSQQPMRNAEDDLHAILQQEWHKFSQRSHAIDEWLGTTNETELVQHLLQQIEEETNVTLSVESFLREYQKALDERDFRDLEWSDRIMKNLPNEMREILILMRRTDRPLAEKPPWMRSGLRSMGPQLVDDFGTLRTNAAADKSTSSQDFQHLPSLQIFHPTTSLVPHLMTETDLLQLKYLDMKPSNLISNDCATRFEVQFAKVLRHCNIFRIQDALAATTNSAGNFIHLAQVLLIGDGDEDITSPLLSCPPAIFQCLLDTYKFAVHSVDDRTATFQTLFEARRIYATVIPLFERAREIETKYNDPSWRKISERDISKSLRAQFKKVYTESCTCVRYFIKDCLDQAHAMQEEDLRFEVLLPMYLMRFHTLPFYEYYDAEIGKFVVATHKETEQEVLAERHSPSLLTQLERIARIHESILNGSLDEAVKMLRPNDFDVSQLRGLGNDRLNLEMDYLLGKNLRVQRFVTAKQGEEIEVSASLAIVQTSHDESLPGTPSLQSSVTRSRTKLLALLDLILHVTPSDATLTVSNPNAALQKLNSPRKLKRLTYDYQLLNFFNHVITNGFHHLPLFTMSIVQLIPHYEKMPKHQQTYLFKEKFHEIHFPDWSRGMIEKYEKLVTWMIKKLLRDRKSGNGDVPVLRHKECMALFGVTLEELRHSASLWKQREDIVLDLLKVACGQQGDLEHKRLLLLNREHFQTRQEEFHELWLQ